MKNYNPKIGSFQHEEDNRSVLVQVGPCSIKCLSLRFSSWPAADIDTGPLFASQMRLGFRKIEQSGRRYRRPTQTENSKHSKTPWKTSLFLEMSNGTLLITRYLGSSLARFADCTPLVAKSQNICKSFRRIKISVLEIFRVKTRLLVFRKTRSMICSSLEDVVSWRLSLLKTRSVVNLSLEDSVRNIWNTVFLFAKRISQTSEFLTQVFKKPKSIFKIILE